MMPHEMSIAVRAPNSARDGIVPLASVLVMAAIVDEGHL
jgi:hypothetical protein